MLHLCVWSVQAVFYSVKESVNVFQSERDEASPLPVMLVSEDQGRMDKETRTAVKWI